MQIRPVFADSITFVMETDASGVGLGAVLVKEVEDGTLHPVAYASRTLPQLCSNRARGPGMVWAAKHFRHVYKKVVIGLP